MDIGAIIRYTLTAGTNDQDGSLHIRGKKKDQWKCLYEYNF